MAALLTSTPLDVPSCLSCSLPSSCVFRIGSSEQRNLLALVNLLKKKKSLTGEESRDGK